MGPQIVFGAISELCMALIQVIYETTGFLFYAKQIHMNVEDNITRVWLYLMLYE